VTEAGKKALRDTLKKRKIKAEVLDGLWKFSYRVKREIEGEPLVSIIIPFKDKMDILKVCLNSIFEKTTYKNYEIILIDNASELLETIEYMKEVENCPRVRLFHYNAPFNYSAINNFAVLQSKGDYLLLLNNDTEVIEPEWIENMLEHAQRPEVGAVGAKLLYPVNLIQHAGVIIGVGGVANHAFSKKGFDDPGYFGLINSTRNLSAVTAACMMTRRDVYEKMHGLDEENLAVAFNDVDFCLRLREQGYLIVYTPYALLYHHESLSRGYDVNFNEEYFIRRRHQGILKQGDPYYNPNLTQERLDYSLKVSDKVQEV
jgi:GT2 family glycosyltransferase